MAAYQHVYNDSLDRWVPVKTTDLGGTGGGSTNVPPVSRSGTIATGGSSQMLMAANAARTGWWVQNLSSADLWVNEVGGAAAEGQPSLRVPAGALYECPRGGAALSQINIFGVTTGQAFTAREF